MKKLTIELVPSNLWKCNLREFLTQKSWDLVRKNCYKNANHTCEICGGKGVYGKGHPVECHEIWVYDDINKIQILDGVISLCTICHRTKHFGLSSKMGYTEMCKKQLMKVNNWTLMQCVGHINEEFIVFKNRNKYDWDVNLNWLKNIHNLITFKEKYEHLKIFIQEP